MSRTHGHEWDKLPFWVCLWYKAGRGRYWKKALSKARRRYHKALLRGIRTKEPTNYESTCNWKDS